VKKGEDFTKDGGRLIGKNRREERREGYSRELPPPRKIVAEHREGGCRADGEAIERISGRDRKGKKIT